MASAERAALVFNGDFHWFDRDAATFEHIGRRVSTHLALRGNVETELGRDDDVNAGCGCAYPESVGQAIVDRSNSILSELKRTARRCGRGAALAALPMTLVAKVGDCRVAIVHGDSETLAGWRFSVESLREPGAASWLEQVNAQSNIDIFASSHTCLPAMRSFALASGQMVIANNGAAGMPNFSGNPCGVVTRIGLTPSTSDVLHRIELRDVYVEAVPVYYGVDIWQQYFTAQWPHGTAAWLSYWDRILNGPAHMLEDAYGPNVCQQLASMAARREAAGFTGSGSHLPAEA